MSKRVPRWTPPIPPVPMNLIPAARQTASVPPTVVAPISPRATQTPSSRGPAFRADASNRSSSLSVSPTRISPSSTPIVAGTAPAARTRRSLSSPTADALSRREAVRDDRRLERDDGLGLAHLVRDPDHGIVPRLATQRAAASIASSAPPTR